MNNNNRSFVNGIILSALVVFLILYFSINGMWGIAQIVVLIILAAIAALQFYIHVKFFKNNRSLRNIKKK